MMDVDNLSDAELRTKLMEFGFGIMPVTGTTRKVMVKKLKILMENQAKTSKENRRSLARYSSEEESDHESRSEKKQNRRLTMPAPLTKLPFRKSVARKVENKNEEIRNTPPVITEERTEVITRTSRVTDINDDYDTGTDSESEVVESTKMMNNKSSYGFRPSLQEESQKQAYGFRSSLQEEPQKQALPKVPASPSRSSLFTSPLPSERYQMFSSTSVDNAADHLNQIRSRLSLENTSIDKSLYSETSHDSDSKIETPFLSNFTKRLSEMSANNLKLDYENKRDAIKEQDSNGSSSYATRTYLSRPVKRDFVKSYQLNKDNNFRNSLVSFAVIGVAVLFFAVLAILYMGMHKGEQTAVDSIMDDVTTIYCQDNNSNLKEGVNCIVSLSDLQDAVEVYKLLKPELVNRALTHQCENSNVKPYMTETEAIDFIRKRIFDIDETSALNNMEILIFTNQQWNIMLLSRGKEDIVDKNLLDSMMEVIDKRATGTVLLSVADLDIPWKCSLYNKISLIIQTIFILLGIFLLLYLSNIGYKYYRYYNQKRKDELYYMVEQIIDMLQSNVGEDGDNYLVINHVRDMILPLHDRKRMEKTWQKAVKFINENESRVRTELQSVQGEPYEVWRWLSTPNLNSSSPKSKSWQGQAFETNIGSVNSLSCSPTPCLKIRGMVEKGDRNVVTIKEAVLSKCAHHCRILHCDVDTTYECVYLKCADKTDAAIAYRSLHGWWYASNLVTVKYVRLERYMQRYPDSPVSGPPYLKALKPSTD